MVAGGFEEEVRIIKGLFEFQKARTASPSS
jgi:hypothetical protein